jgi:cell division septation protein DedD
MPKNEEGEFELILGNRQLLSVFFIVVVLLGVFFTMGYIVGRNSGPGASAEVATTKKDTKPMVVDSAAPPASSPAPAPEVKPTVVETRPQQAEPEKSEAPKAEHQAATKADPPKLVKKEAPAPEPASAGGFYLQLTATTQHEAEVYADVLKKKGFKAITSAVPDKPGLIRVMVGPLAESAISKTRVDLNAAGFPGDKAIKRTL